jgi:hypothetical protein
LLALGALPGILSTVPLAFGAHAATNEDWKLLALQRMAYHLDPLSWRVRYHVLLPMLLALVWLYVRSLGSPRPWRLVAWFLTAAFVVFLGGFACRLAGRYSWLGTFPFRIFPLFTPLVFLGAALAWLGSSRTKAMPVILSALVVLSLALLPDPLTPYAKALANKRLGHGLAASDLRRCYDWIATNTPPDAIGMVPPRETQFAWYFMGRGLVVTLHYNPYDRVSEWRERCEAFAGPFNMEEGRDERSTAFYESIPAERMVELCARYDASFLLTRAHYPFPVGFESGAYRVYLVR